MRRLDALRGIVVIVARGVMITWRRIRIRHLDLRGFGELVGSR